VVIAGVVPLVPPLVFNDVLEGVLNEVEELGVVSVDEDEMVVVVCGVVDSVETLLTEVVLPGVVFVDVEETLGVE